MAQRTQIQWADSTVNPVMGCRGCELWTPIKKDCYAGRLHDHGLAGKNPGYAPRFELPTLFPGRMQAAARWGDLVGQARTTPGYLKPWLDGHPRLIFLSDMADALSEGDFVEAEDLEERVDGGGKRRFVAPDGRIQTGGVPFTFLKAEVIDVVSSNMGSRHRWLWLTKRPRRLREFEAWLRETHGLTLPSNLWVGTSVTSARTLPRVAELQEVGGPQTIRFVSAEPLWEAISLRPFLADGRRWWVIAGGESTQDRGPPSEPEEFKLEWARSLRDECRELGAPFFLKQLGSKPTDEGEPLEGVVDGHGGNMDEWPVDLRVRQLPPLSWTCGRTFPPPR